MQDIIIFILIILAIFVVLPTIIVIAYIIIYKIKQWFVIKNIIKENNPEDKDISTYIPDKIEIAKELIQKDFITQVDFYDTEGTPYMFYFNDLKTVKKFIELGVDPNILNAQGLNILSHNGRCYYHHYGNQYEYVKYLIDQGTDIYIIDPMTQRNLLFRYCYSYKIIKLLVQKGVNIHQIDNKQQNILFKIKHFKIFKYLVNLGVDIHQVNQQNQNLLFNVIDQSTHFTYGFDRKNNDGIKIIKLLLQLGINKYHTLDDQGKQTILHYIIDKQLQYSNHDLHYLFQFFINNGYDPEFNENLQTESILWKAQKLDTILYTYDLIDHNANIHTLNQNGQNLLFVITQHDMYKTLLRKGINIHCVDNDLKNIFDQYQNDKPSLCLMMLKHFNENDWFCKNPNCWCEDKQRLLDLKKKFFKYNNKNKFNKQYCKWCVKRFYRNKTLKKFQDIVIQIMRRSKIGFISTNGIEELF